MADTPDRTNQTREVCYKESMEASSKKDTPGAVEDENTPSTSRVTSASGVNAKTFTVTRTTTITDRAGNVVQESSVSQDVESHISGEQENDFIAELVALSVSVSFGYASQLCCLMQFQTYQGLPPPYLRYVVLTTSANCVLVIWTVSNCTRRASPGLLPNGACQVDGTRHYMSPGCNVDYCSKMRRYELSHYHALGAEQSYSGYRPIKICTAADPILAFTTDIRASPAESNMPQVSAGRSSESDEGDTLYTTSATTFEHGVEVQSKPTNSIPMENGTGAIAQVVGATTVPDNSDDMFQSAVFSLDLNINIEQIVQGDCTPRGKMNELVVTAEAKEEEAKRKREEAKRKKEEEKCKKEEEKWKKEEEKKKQDEQLKK
ncbi:hypothetical protein NM688_g4568 [Phlebia brevispora]|uniref:Uncharacterized protein n=1 Tax=Phlebia brevispora TaxID=194682 RepID=A0ACC1T2Q0_9APHY|nr:hypothetical protein NM688_g4568 [Phlebia brevispora]